MSTPSATVAMNLATEDVQFIKGHLGEWLTEQSLGKPPAVYEIELRERMIRAEEELGHQRELIKTILEQMDKRFEAVDKRFDAVDKRFELMQEEMNRRFEAVDKRFELMQKEMDKRFEAVNRRFELMQEEMNRRFDAIDKRFDAVDRRFEALTRRIDRFMMWSFAITLSVGGLVVTILKLWL